MAMTDADRRIVRMIRAGITVEGKTTVAVEAAGDYIPTFLREGLPYERTIDKRVVTKGKSHDWFAEKLGDLAQTATEEEGFDILCEGGEEPTSKDYAIYFSYLAFDKLRVPFRLDLRELSYKFEGAKVGGPGGADRSLIQRTYRRRENFSTSATNLREVVRKSDPERSTTEVEEEDLEKLFVGGKLLELGVREIRKDLRCLFWAGPKRDLRQDVLFDVGTSKEKGVAQLMIDWVLKPLELVRERPDGTLEVKRVEIVSGIPKTQLLGDRLPSPVPGAFRQWVNAMERDTFPRGFRKFGVPAAIQWEVVREDGTAERVWVIHPELYFRHLTLAYLAYAKFMAAMARTARGLTEAAVTELPVIGPVGAVGMALIGGLYGAAIGSSLHNIVGVVAYKLGAGYEISCLTAFFSLLTGYLGWRWFKRLTIGALRSPAPTWPFFAGVALLAFLGAGVIRSSTNLAVASIRGGSPLVIVWVVLLVLTFLATQWGINRIARRYITTTPR